MIDLLLNMLAAYHERERHVVRGLTANVNATNGEEGQRLRAVLHRHIQLQDEAAQAIRSLTILKRGGFPQILKQWVGPEAGEEVRGLLLDMVEAEAVLDTQPDAVRGEFLSLPCT